MFARAMRCRNNFVEGPVIFKRRNSSSFKAPCKKSRHNQTGVILESKFALGLLHGLALYLATMLVVADGVCSSLLLFLLPVVACSMCLNGFDA